MVKLSDTDWKIMELLWDKSPLSTMDIVHALDETMGWARSTVITLLNRMTSKGLITFKSENKTKLYYPAIDRSQVELEETKSFLQKFYNGNIGLLVSNLIKQESITEEEMEDLRRIIKDGD